MSQHLLTTMFKMARVHKRLGSMLALLALCSACNLFSRSETPEREAEQHQSDADGVPDAAPATDVGAIPDSGMPDLMLPDASFSDASPSSDVSPSFDSQPPDAPSPDFGNDDSSADAPEVCVPPTDQELCADLQFQCGAAYTLSGQETVWQAKDHVVGDACFSSGEADLCSPSMSVEIPWVAPVTEQYLVTITGRSTLWGLPPAQVELEVDGSRETIFPIYNDTNTAEVYSRVIDLTAGNHLFVFRLINDAFGDSPDADRNAMLKTIAIQAAPAGVLDRCGQQRFPDCGGCPGEDRCGFRVPGECACPCPMPDGSCAPVDPMVDVQCTVCTVDGWEGVAGVSCSDGDPCTDDYCETDEGVCISEKIVCNGNKTCVMGVCQ